MIEYHNVIIRQDRKTNAYCFLPNVEKPIRIEKKFMDKTMSGDMVLLKVKDNRYGYVQKLIERPDRILTGQLQINKGYAHIKPWTSEIFIDFFVDKKHLNGAKNGDIVEFKIIEWRKKEKNPRVEILKSIYNTTSEQYLMYRMNLPTKFENEVIEECSLFNEETILFEKTNRIDLTHLDVFSIDPENCTDVDDALSFEITKTGYRIGVHISDVSFFVKPGTELDKEAMNRAFTTYLPQTNIPMIPRKLSSDLCSLLQGVDRLAVSTLFNFDNEWNLLDYDICRTTINNKHKMTYEEAEAHKNDTQSTFYMIMNQLYNIGNKIRKQHFKEELVLNLPENQFIFDKENNPIKIYNKKRISTMDLIQSWMLITNLYATKKLKSLNSKAPWIYRTHYKIEEENILLLKKELNQLGEFWDDNLEHIENIKKLLNNDNSKLISEIIIRKFRPAKYTTKQDGHFSLDNDEYTHFTSPIRRFSDIIIHRILINSLNNKNTYCVDLEKDCEWISSRERKIDKIVKKYNNINVMKFVKNIDYVFSGYVINISNKGLVIKTDLCVDGFVVLEDLKDYHFDETELIFRGKNDIKIGNKLDFKIKNLDEDKNNIGLEIWKI